MSLSRNGGFAGLSSQWEVQVDEQPDPDQWRTVIEACPWADARRGGDGGSRGADRFTYQIRAGRRSAVLDEQHLQGPWRTLAELVKENGRRLPAR